MIQTSFQRFTSLEGCSPSWRTKDYATAVLQVKTLAVHGLAQQTLHVSDLDHKQVEVFESFPSKPFPSLRNACPGIESAKESPDFRDRKSRLSSDRDNAQIEHSVCGKTALAVLAEGRWEKSGPFVEMDGGWTDTCTPGYFSDSHFPP